MSERAKSEVDWRKTPPFVTSESGGGKYQVVIRVGSIHQLHAAHDLVNKGFSDWLSAMTPNDKQAVPEREQNS